MTGRREPPLDMPPWTLRLPEDASAPAVARAALDEWLRDADEIVRRDARSIVSELVGSAVSHGGPPIELSVERRDDRVRIEVTDEGDPSRPRPLQCWSERIVGGLAARWGVRGDDAHVWFELPVAARDPAGRSHR